MTDAKKKRPRDPNQLAKLVIDLATGEADEPYMEMTDSSLRFGLQSGIQRPRRGGSATAARGAPSGGGC